jgi:hypothetical protein
MVITKLDFTRLFARANNNDGYCPSVFIDVDYVIINPDGSVNQTIVKTIKDLKAEYGDNIDIIVWSSGGKAYAKAAVEKAELNDFVDGIVSKPHYIVDDFGDMWHCNLLTIIDFDCSKYR